MKPLVILLANVLALVWWGAGYLWGRILHASLSDEEKYGVKVWEKILLISGILLLLGIYCLLITEV